MKKTIVALLVLVMLVGSLSVCLFACNKDKGSDGADDDVNPNLDLTKPVTLKLLGSKDVWPAMDSIINKFEAKYKNCSITYEFLQDYEKLLPERLALSADETLANENADDLVDIFYSRNTVESDTAYGAKVIPNAYNLLSRPDVLDLSATNRGIVDNYKSVVSENTQYIIPYGGELRGMYVNKTLLASCGLTVPTNRAEFLECCRILKERGYIPIQSDPGSFGQQLVYPMIVNSIVNSENPEAAYNEVNTIQDGMTDRFEDAYSLVYDLVSADYFDYKKSEALPIGSYTYVDETTNAEVTKTTYAGKYSGEIGKARSFLNVYADSKTTFAKKDDVGQIAFMTDALKLQTTMEKVKSEHGSNIDYEFILSPIDETKGGYAYMSPSSGLGINKHSKNAEWALEFLDFFYKEENLKTFASLDGCIPIIKDSTMALDQYDVSADHISNVGQATFDYLFYSTVTKLLLGGYQYTYTKADVDPAYLAEHAYTYTDDAETMIKFTNQDGPDDMIGISKMNAPKYKNADGSIRFTKAEYLERLEEEFLKVKASWAA